MIHDWGVLNKLCFNTNKTKAIVFNKPRHRNLYTHVPTLRMDGKHIAVVRELKYLGIILDHTLSWNSHIEYITKHTGYIMHAFAKVARSTWGLGGNAKGAIYDSIFVPIITYGCGTWSVAAEKVHQKRKLISAQRRALLLITKAYRTTANVSLQLLARKPPIDKYINYLQKLCKIKRGDSPASHSEHFIEESWEENIPFQHTLSPYTNNRYIETSPASCAITIFTDGSKYENNVGASFVVYCKKIEIYCKSFQLGPLCSIFQAELYAILQAVVWCEWIINNTQIIIITDSLSSLNAIKKLSDHPLAFYIQRILVDSDNDYYFKWIRSHSEVWGNDRADHLAKTASVDQNIVVSYNKISTKILKEILCEDMLMDWQRDWDDNISITKQFFPNILKFLHNTWILVTHHTVQFYTGHGRFNSYLSCFTSHNNKLCPVCGINDSSYHYIFECPMTETERHQLMHFPE
ncbi:uncharacterized protein LOC111639625 [Centruroides sculpturatus]|uniref:uncharacterized protein LOC111639625 n=1 Tax=Centruroides sculpturatus TaxID=218467 RepID=UPI000C6CEF7B|nr:uncharacterized protein LOC111639625 [Centruroides sculpturatus]